jgi:hypothetical protein
MHDLTSFVPDGTRLLEAVFGDLDDDGRPDALLVLDPPRTQQERWGKGPFREVVLLIRDASGVLRKAASNSLIVPGAANGGLAGDPFGYAIVVTGGFTIVNGGGGRARWWDEFTFSYVADRKDWFITRVLRQVVDSHTGEEQRAEWMGKNLDTVSFSEFDPARLADGVLP